MSRAEKNGQRAIHIKLRSLQFPVQRRNSCASLGPWHGCYINTWMEKREEEGAVAVAAAAAVAEDVVVIIE